MVVRNYIRETKKYSIQKQLLWITAFSYDLLFH